MKNEHSKGQKLSVSFDVNLFRRSEAPKNLDSPEYRAKEGIFGVQELRVGEEPVVIVMGKTIVTIGDE